MIKFKAILLNHITKWNMVWFGLIFWGSVFNAASVQIGMSYSPVLWYLLGLLFGIIAKIRGTWLWKV